MQAGSVQHLSTDRAVSNAVAKQVCEAVANKISKAVANTLSKAVDKAAASKAGKADAPTVSKAATRDVTKELAKQITNSVSKVLAKGTARALRMHLAQQHPLLERSREMYMWASALADMLSGGCPAPELSAPVVKAAAEVAAWHLQHLTDIDSFNTLLRGLHLRQVQGPRIEGVAAAVQLAKAYLALLGKCRPSGQQQQQQQGHQQQQRQQQQQEQQQQDQLSYQQQVQEALELKEQAKQRLQLRRQQQPPGSLSADEARMLQIEYCWDLLPLCVTVLAADALQLPQLIWVEANWQEMQVSQSFCRLVARSPACSTSSGPCTCTTCTSTSGSSSSSSQCSCAARAAEAAALPAEQTLLLSARCLQHCTPAWLAAAPSWQALLQGAWQGLGYPTQLQDSMVHCDRVTCNQQAFSWGREPSKPAASVARSAGRCEHDAGSGGSSRRSSSSGSDNTYGDALDDAYQQPLNSCVARWRGIVRVLLQPLQQPGNTAAADALKALQKSDFAAGAAAQLPVVLLAVAHAALREQADAGLQLAAAAVEAVGEICSSCQVALAAATGQQQHQQLPNLQKQPGGQQPQAQGQQQRWGELQHKQEDAQQQLQAHQQLPRSQQQQHCQQCEQQAAAPLMGASWQLADLVLLLMDQMATEAALCKERWHRYNHHQQQQQQGASAATDTTPVWLAPASASVVETLLQCWAVLPMLLTDRVIGSFLSAQQCSRLADVLQVLESGVRSIFALQSAMTPDITSSSTIHTSSSNSSGSSSGSGSSGSSPTAEGPTAAAAAAAGAGTTSEAVVWLAPVTRVMQVCTEVLTGLLQNQLHTHSNVGLLDNPSRLRKQQRQQQRRLQVALAALSLMVLKHASVTMCDHDSI
jgi:hypothetical protein